MNVPHREKQPRKGQVSVQAVLGLGSLSAATLAYGLSGADLSEVIIVPILVIGVVLFGVAVYRRTRARQEWLAAWDAYAAREFVASAENLDGQGEIFSPAHTN